MTVLSTASLDGALLAAVKFVCFCTCLCLFGPRRTVWWGVKYHSVVLVGCAGIILIWNEVDCEVTLNGFECFLRLGVLFCVFAVE